MNQPRSKHLIAAGLLAVLGLAATAQTPPSAPTAADTVPRAQREHRGHFDAARMQERMAKQQADLKQKLQLTPAQESAWNAYTAALQPPANAMRPERGELARLTTPERIERMRAVHAARAAALDRRADAIMSLYAVLSPDQKKLFDAETARRGHGRHPGGHHHRA